MKAYLTLTKTQIQSINFNLRLYPTVSLKLPHYFFHLNWPHPVLYSNNVSTSIPVCQIWAQSGSVWSKMRQKDDVSDPISVQGAKMYWNRNWLSPVFVPLSYPVSHNVSLLKSDLKKSPGFVPHGANLTQFDQKSANSSSAPDPLLPPPSPSYMTQ